MANKTEIKFYNGDVDTSKIKFVTIIGKDKDRTMFVRTPNRKTIFELPTVEINEGETTFTAAIRCLSEEANVTRSVLRPMCIYSVTGATPLNPNGRTVFGMLYIAEILRVRPREAGQLSSYELFDNEFPKNMAREELDQRFVTYANLIYNSYIKKGAKFEVGDIVSPYKQTKGPLRTIQKGVKGTVCEVPLNRKNVVVEFKNSKDEIVDVITFTPDQLRLEEQLESSITHI